MEFIYVLDNIDCFSSMERDIVIDGENVLINNISSGDTSDKYKFIYSLPSDYDKDTIRAITCCGLITTINVKDLNNKEYIADIQKSAIKEYDNRKEEHTQFTDFLYEILTHTPKIMTAKNGGIISQQQEDENTIDVDLVEGD